MSQSFAVFVLMSNYFHDVATAMLMACSLTLWLILRQYDRKRGVTTELLRILQRRIAVVVKVSWAWIFAGGAVRVVTFRSFEWPNAVGKGHEQALLVKYAIAAAMILGGAYFWSRLARKTAEATSDAGDGMHDL